MTSKKFDRIVLTSARSIFIAGHFLYHVSLATEGMYQSSNYAGVIGEKLLIILRWGECNLYLSTPHRNKFELLKPDFTSRQISFFFPQTKFIWLSKKGLNTAKLIEMRISEKMNGQQFTLEELISHRDFEHLWKYAIQDSIQIASSIRHGLI